MKPRRTRREQIMLAERWLRIHAGRARSRLRSLIPWLIAPIAVVYQGATVLREYNQPDPTFWISGPGSHWLAPIALLGLVSVAYVAFETILANRVTRRQENLLKLEELAQALLINIYEAANYRIAVTSLVAHIMTLRRGLSGQWFERTTVFKLNSRIPATGLVWRRGKGALGLAWDYRAPYTLDLAALHALYAQGSAVFDAAPATERLGLTAQEFQSARYYWCVYVGPLLDNNGEVIGAATVSCTEEGKYTLIRDAANAPGVDEPLTLIEATIRNS